MSGGRTRRGPHGPGLSGLPGYLVVMLGETVSGIGSNLTTFVLTLWAWDRYGSAAAIAQVALAFALPQLLFTLVAGVLVDRWNRRAILVVGNLVLAALVGLLAVLMSSGQLVLWEIYAVGAVQSFFAALGDQTLGASISLMVGREQLMRMNGVTQCLNVLAPICAPLLGSLLVDLVSPYWLLVGDCGSFLVVVAAVGLVAVPRPAAGAPDGQRTGPREFVRQLALGTRFLLARRYALTLVAAFAGYQLFRSALQVLLLPMAASVWIHDPASGRLLPGSAAATGIFAAATALRWIGTFSGGAVVFWIGEHRDKAALMVGCLAVGGVCQALNGSSLFLVAAAGLLLGGVAGALIRAAFSTLLLPEIPAELQGRVLSTAAVITQIGTSAGLLLIAQCSGFASAAELFVASGVGILVLAAGTAVALRAAAPKPTAADPTPAAADGLSSPASI